MTDLFKYMSTTQLIDAVNSATHSIHGQVCQDMVDEYIAARNLLEIVIDRLLTKAHALDERIKYYNDLLKEEQK